MLPMWSELYFLYGMYAIALGFNFLAAFSTARTLKRTNDIVEANPIPRVLFSRIPERFWILVIPAWGFGVITGAYWYLSFTISVYASLTGFVNLLVVAITGFLVWDGTRDLLIARG